MRSSSLLILALVLGTLGCKKKDGIRDVEERLAHENLSDIPHLGRTVDITCWSAGVKIFEGQADSAFITVRGERIIHFRAPRTAENEGVDNYVRVTGDCVAKYTARRE